MNKDKLIRIFTALVILLAILFFSVGKWTYSGIAILAALAIHMNTGGGDFNHRNLYEKKVQNTAGWTLEEICKRLGSLETPLGTCWMGSKKENNEKCIVFGPALFKDYIYL